MKHLVLFISSLAVVVVLSASCDSGSHIIPEPPQFRHVAIGSEINSGTTPFNWQYTISVYQVTLDFPRTMVELATKIEVDFGDGGGYLDVTNEVVTFWQSQGPKPVHTYVEKGEYEVECRVTYYDGRAVTGKMIPLFVQVE
jgi:hypothetical protein